MIFPRFRKSAPSRPHVRKPFKHAFRVEQLETREVLATYPVLNLNDAGAGSLRQALADANLNAGADTIRFDIPGTIRLTSGALPAIIGQVAIDGSTAPGFAGNPVVEVDYNLFGGLVFQSGSTGSSLRSLAHAGASGAGVSVNGAGSILVAGNFIGLRLDGSTVLANGGNGLEFNASSGNTVGGTAAGDRNVISGNLGNGISFSGSTNNRILGNYIGTDAGGALDRGNLGNGIRVTALSAGNSIGGSPGNVISGNDANGVLLDGDATANIVEGNLIGLAATATAALGNTLDGVSIQNSNGNLIGHIDPVTGVTYGNTDNVPVQPVSAWQGIRNSDIADSYLITGSSNLNGLLFEGTIAGVGTGHLVNYPNAASTSVYGPDNLAGAAVRLVGSYKNADAMTSAVKVHGFLFEGTTADLSNPANYREISIPGAEFTYVHSTMGGLAVGNYDSAAAHGTFNLPLGPGHAFLYDVATNAVLTDIVFPGSLSNTAYGIWYNGGTSYTICGGWSPDPVNNFADRNQPIGQGYLVDYDSLTGQFSNWTSFTDPAGVNFITHFEGISSVEKGIYTLNADTLQAGTGNPGQGSWVSVRRNADGTFGQAAWVELNYPGLDPTTNVSSSNSVYGNQVVGLVIGANPLSYQATINSAFQLSNVISGNGGNGVSLRGADDNRIAMNYIGTDKTGTLDFGNIGNGILVTDGSAGNRIGGEATGGNDPTNGIFARPPQGNLISGNNANGVLINGAATGNILSGNYIGTAYTGTSALGNTLDGVAIENADGNELIGCTVVQDPFIYFNVIGGNGGNGLRVNNSNNTIIQANFFGLGSDNNTPVGNTLSGVVIEGSSANTTLGGRIPLGNVSAANGMHGVVLKDTASGFLSFNTFAGVAAFNDNLTLGNGLDGFHITSTGGGNILRTNVISSNGDDGVEISGNATGVQVVQNIIGLNTDAEFVMPNGGNGIEIGGTAHGITIGGSQTTFSVIPRNALSGNLGYGIAFVGAAHDNTLDFSYIGLGFDTAAPLPLGNGLGGVFLGAGTTANQVGSADPQYPTHIAGNTGNGITIEGSNGNKVVGTNIGVFNGIAVPNTGDGIRISGSNNRIGGNLPNEGNNIAFNALNGVSVQSGNGNAILRNSITGNTLKGILLAPGANSSQAAPVITSVSFPSGSVSLTGTLRSTPNRTFSIELFSDGSSQPAEGKTYLGTTTATTDGSGLATFTFTGTLAQAASVFSATATDATNNTSEFGAADGSIVFDDLNADGIQQSTEPGLANRTVFLDLNGNGKLDPGETSTVTASNGSFTLSGPGTLTQVLFAGDLNVAGGTATRSNSSLTVIPAAANLFAAAATPNATFVQGLYRGILGREAATSEVALWVAALDAGTSKTSVSDAIWASTEHRRAQVNGYYVTYLGRSADAAGEAAWVASFKAGATEEQVVTGFLASAEYRAFYPTDTGFVNSLYQNLLGRDRTPGEAPGWEELVIAKGRAAVVGDFIAANEAQTRAVTGFYAGILNRIGETPGVQSWIRELATDKLTYGGVAVQFFASAEFSQPHA